MGGVRNYVKKYLDLLHKPRTHKDKKRYKRNDYRKEEDYYQGSRCDRREEDS